MAVTTLAVSAAAQAEIRMLAVGGVTIRCRDTGGPGEPVLLSHGIGGSLELWSRQFDSVDPALRLIAWDMPSHGLSDATPDGASLDGIARTAWQLLDALGLQQVVLAGNSLGGAVSLRMAATAPQRVRGLLLVAAATLGPDSPLPFRLMTLPVLGTLMTRPGPMAVQQQVKAIVHRPASVTPDVLAAIERNVMRPGGAAHFLQLLRSTSTFGGMKRAVWMRSHDILKQLQMPVAFLHGELDAVLPMAHSRQAQALVPGSVLTVLPGCGHTPQLEQPAAFKQALDDLLRQVPAAPRAG
ncbi:MAG: alpha/beta fold hydrolase [Aquabacterium sp.]|nr:alpha/beta fold hydrolase [Aquabacterium sp.]